MLLLITVIYSLFSWWVWFVYAWITCFKRILWNGSQMVSWLSQLTSFLTLVLSSFFLVPCIGDFFFLFLWVCVSFYFNFLLLFKWCIKFLILHTIFEFSQYSVIKCHQSSWSLPFSVINQLAFTISDSFSLILIHNSK